MMQLAFYKGTRPGLPGLYNRLVRWFMKGPYSHCELVFSDGRSASASFMDHGVRVKTIQYNDGKWDLIALNGFNEAKAAQWFHDHLWAPYDILGNLGFIWRPLSDSKGDWFCSEACAAALGIPDPWRFDPNTLHAALVCQNNHD